MFAESDNDGSKPNGHVSKVGDTAFFKGVREYYLAHKDKNADSEDLRAALEKTSGQNLKQFFASWVYGAGHPVYEVSWQPAGSKRVNLILKQTQPEGAFPNAVPLEITIAGGKKRVVVTPQDKLTTQLIQVDAQPLSITIDPDNTILR